MSEKRRDRDYLEDIFEAISRISKYTADYDYDKFFSDKKTQDAIIRNLEVIGQATKGLSNNLKNKYPKIKWKDMAGLRDKLIHHYFGINYDIVWNIVDEELQPLQQQIKELLSKETN